MSINMKIGVLGAGKMAGALIKGWVNCGAVEAQKVGPLYSRHVLSCRKVVIVTISGGSMFCSGIMPPPPKKGTVFLRWKSA
jgi:hypothetical protein